MEIGDIRTFTIYEHQPSLTVTFKAKVIGLPTSEAMQGTVKVEVLSIEEPDQKRRRFNRNLVGKHLRCSLSQLQTEGS